MNDYLEGIRIFISKPEHELHLLPSFCKLHKLELIAHSFLEYEKVDFNIDFQYFDSIFFSSPRSAQFFLTELNCSLKRIAVAGGTTAHFVKKYGLSIDFLPLNSGNIQQSVEEFTRWADQNKIKKILFPISNLSNQSYTKLLPNDRYSSVCVYRTLIGEQEISPCNIYIFTSPSNVKGFLKKNVFFKNNLVVAWGESTYDSLKNHLPKQQIFTMERSTEMSCIELIKKKLDVLNML